MLRFATEEAFMRHQASVAVVVVICLYQLSLTESLTAAAVETASLRQQVTEYGVGAKLSLKLAGGKKLRGSVESIDDAGFQLSKPNREAVHVRYDDLALVKLAERAYRARQDPDPVEARRMVLSLGAGKHVVVKLTGREFHGHIQSIAAETFTLLPDRGITPIQIAYRDVHYVEKNLSFGATIVLVVLILAAVVVAATVAATR
jgi:ribosome maturation factor RimP